MLVPSSGCIAIYGVGGDLIWCSDGFERPDLRELVEELRQARNQEGYRGQVRQTSTGVTAFSSVLRADDGRGLGFVLIELGSLSGGSMAPSLLRPVLECLAARIHLEQTAAAARGAAAKLERAAPDHNAPGHGSDIDDLELLIGFSDQDGPEGRHALERLVEQCVQNLGCVSGALFLPDQGLNIVSKRNGAPGANRFLDRTQKHLLAWAQLNNRPMVVNRIGNDPKMAPYKILSCPVRDKDQRVAGLLALFRAADEPNFEIRDVRILEFVGRRIIGILSSRHDSLTGLMNRLVFEEQVQARLRGPLGDDRGMLLYLDIDRLQHINDAFGFDAGDEVIRRLGEIVRGHIGPDDAASRIAGDRFAVFMPASDEAGALLAARRMLDAMSQLEYLNGADAVPVSVCIGLAGVGPGLADARHLLAAAELACKRAQQHGRNRLEVYTPSESLPPSRQQELFAAANLQQALQKSEFRLLAQPIVGLAAAPGSLAGFEVLVRMRDGNGALVSPDKFMVAAERYGLMPAVDKWVLATAIQEAKSRVDSLADLPLGLSINVSGQSLANGAYGDYVLELLEQHGLPGQLLCFELKESVAVNHLAEAESFIEQMRSAKCRVALDDFGTGLTSLTHLKRLRVNLLKIDGSLVRRALDDLYVESLILGLAKAAQTLGVATVAEHVESEILADKLRQMGIDYAQGYCYGHPKPLIRVLGEAVRPEPLLKAGQS